jgi:hypothetical protein
MQADHIIVPQGIKRVGSAAQVDNEKMRAAVLIAAEYRTWMILPPMTIFTGVYGAKLMQHWESFDDAKIVFNESHWMTSQTTIIYLNFFDYFQGGKLG